MNFETTKKLFRKLQVILAVLIIMLVLLLFAVFVIRTKITIENVSKNDVVFSNSNDVGNFGGEEYECYGSCFCEDQRRSATTTGVRGLRYVVAAFTSLIAIEQARKHFFDECQMEYQDFCDEPSSIRSEVDNCVYLESRVSKNERSSYERGMDQSNSCNDKCGEQVGDGEGLCWCDSLCIGNEDCCDDFEDQCSDYVEKKNKKKSPKEVKKFVKNNMKYVSQACITIVDNGDVIYTDPYRTSPGSNDADVILITHDHYDHWSVEDCQNVVKDDTVFVVPSTFSDAVEESFPDHQVIPVGTNDRKIQLNDITIETIPAYNTDKEYHKKSSGWVGYVIELRNSGMRVYHSGDTNRIPEMKDLEDIDVSLLPLGHTYTMDSVEEAVLAARDTGATVAVPMHYGVYEGKDSDAKVFEDECEEIGIDAVNLKDLGKEK